MRISSTASLPAAAGSAGLSLSADSRNVSRAVTVARAADTIGCTPKRKRAQQQSSYNQFCRNIVAHVCFPFALNTSTARAVRKPDFKAAALRDGFVLWRMAGMPHDSADQAGREAAGCCGMTARSRQRDTVIPRKSAELWCSSVDIRCLGLWRNATLALG